MANALTINQISSILNAIMLQATGRNAIAVTDTSSFVTVGQQALLVGADPLMQAITQVLSRTIFSIRPYDRKFRGLETDNMQWGNFVRKLKIADGQFEDDERLPLTEDGSVDQYKVKKPNVLQLNFYGSETYQKHITIFRDQLDTAFTSPEEFSRFVTMIMTNATNQLEGATEALARATLANLIGGIISMDDDNQVVHLLTEYNTLTGLSLTSETVYQPDNFKPFMQWVYARIAAITAMMTERTTMFQHNVTGKAITQHTPYADQRVYLYAPARYQIEMQVLADTYHDNYLRQAVNETVNYWQNPESPATINVTPSIMNGSGSAEKASAVNQGNVFGLIMDRNAAGINRASTWSAPTPFNAAGGYTNIFWHMTNRYYNDFTEKAVVLLLD